MHKIVEWMTVPLVQGALRYAYKVSELDGGDKEVAEGWAFSAAVLPLVDNCDATSAAVIRRNMHAFDGTGVADGHMAVKEAFEAVYNCLGVTCARVGGLVSGNGYYTGMEPCEQADLPGGEESDGGTGSAAICIDAAAVAELSDGSQKALRDLEIGDEILTSDAQNGLSFSEVIFLPHADAKLSRTEMVEVTTEDGRSLRLTPAHLVAKFDGECSAAVRSAADLVAARDVRVGDCLFGVGAASAVRERKTVVENAHVMSVVTMNAGLPVLNGLAASSFVVSDYLPHQYYNAHRALYKLGFADALRSPWAETVNNAVQSAAMGALALGVGAWMGLKA